MGDVSQRLIYGIEVWVVLYRDETGWVKRTFLSEAYARAFASRV